MIIEVANPSHCVYAHVICETIAESAKQRGTGIAKRTPKYIVSKMNKGDAVIALDGFNFVGFSYIESWSHQKIYFQFGIDCSSELQGSRHGQAYQEKNL